MFVEPADTNLEHSWTVYCKVERAIVGYVHEQNGREEALAAAYEQFGPGDHVVNRRKTLAYSAQAGDYRTSRNNPWFPWHT